jgi:hypothetical protein
MKIENERPYISNKKKINSMLTFNFCIRAFNLLIILLIN